MRWMSRMKNSRPIPNRAMVVAASENRTMSRTTGAVPARPRTARCAAVRLRERGDGAADGRVGATAPRTAGSGRRRRGRPGRGDGAGRRGRGGRRGSAHGWGGGLRAQGNVLHGHGKDASGGMAQAATGMTGEASRVFRNARMRSLACLGRSTGRRRRRPAQAGRRSVVVVDKLIKQNHR